MHDDSFTLLLKALYAAPTEPRRWNEFLQNLGTTCNVRNGALLAHDFSSGHHSILAGLGDAINDSRDLYERHYWRFDEWSAQIPKRTIQPGRAELGERLWPRPDFFKSVFYNEFLCGFDICQLAAIYFPGQRGAFDGLSLYRGTKDERFDAEQITALNAIAPHLKIALETRRKLKGLEERVSDLESALDAIGSALILLDANGDAILVNSKARCLLSAKNGLRLRKSKLIGPNWRDTSRLQQLIAGTIANPVHRNGAGGGSMPVARAGKRPLHILVAPIGAKDDPVCRRASVAVFIDDPEEHSEVSADVLRALFNLTPAEARLALSILSGNSMVETAQVSGVSRETVKSQMKAVLAKTGTHRQTELVRLLSKLPGVMA